MYIYHNKETDEYKSFRFMTDIVKSLGIPLDVLKYRFSKLKLDRWEFDNCVIVKE